MEQRSNSQSQVNINCLRSNSQYSNMNDLGQFVPNAIKQEAEMKKEAPPPLTGHDDSINHNSNDLIVIDDFDDDEIENARNVNKSNDKIVDKSQLQETSDGFDNKNVGNVNKVNDRINNKFVLKHLTNISSAVLKHPGKHLNTSRDDVMASNCKKWG